MVTWRKKGNGQLDLLNMPNPERIRLIKEIKENLRQKITEAKLWRSLLEVESLTINGNIVYKSCEPLSGFFIHK